MLEQLKRHPIPIEAWFRHCLVLTYAFPESVLRPLLPSGLALDPWRGHGFVAVAMVQTERLRPAGLPPALGCDFFLTGYRIFARYRTRAGRTLRGLRILRSDADRWPMVLGGNLLTHYNYHKCEAACCDTPGGFEVDITTADGSADLRVRTEPSPDAPLPPGSLFADWRGARRFAGPLPFTFDYESCTHSIVRIKGVRRRWDPRPVVVREADAAFLRSPIFGGLPPVLCSAFYTGGVPYRWDRGVVEPLPPDLGKERAA